MNREVSFRTPRSVVYVCSKCKYIYSYYDLYCNIFFETKKTNKNYISVKIVSRLGVVKGGLRFFDDGLWDDKPFFYIRCDRSYVFCLNIISV